ncbi:NYN domain-containing protein [Patescibacteria group bacterium]|nr:NYN domain-containing protein [Patescibacteria group bacterium]
MDEKTEKILKSLNSKKVGIFCDDSNLYYSYKKCGWRVDFGKFKIFLEDYCDLQFINYYIAIPDKSDVDYKGVQDFIQHISPYVNLKRKALKYIYFNGHRTRKGDVDVEITLDVARTIDNLDVILVVSGDSDFLELKNYIVKEKHKQIIFLGYKENLAWELRLCQHIYLNKLKKIVGLDIFKNKPQV